MNFFENMSRSVLLLALSCAAVNVAALTDAEVDKLFNAALNESQTGDVFEAISTFETILSERPSAGRVRLELALANFRALNYAAAREHAEAVLADPETPDGVRNTVKAFLAGIEGQSKHLFTPYISLGWIHDDNVNVGPDSSLIDIGVAVLTLAPGSLPKRDDGLQISAGVGHRYLFDNPVNLFGNQAAVAWLSQASLFRNQYFDEEDFHLNVVSVRTGPSLLVARKWGLQLNGDFNHISIGDKDIAIYAGFNPTLSFFVGEQATLSLSGQIQMRDFDRPQDQDRDSEYYEIGGAFGYRLDTTMPVSLRLGINGYTEDADSARRSNDGWIASFGVNIIPFDNFNVFLNYFHRDRSYDAPEPIFATKRDENEDRYIVGASWRLPITGVLNGLEL